MSNELDKEKLLAVESALLANPHFADRRLAMYLPVYGGTVRKIRRKMVAEGRLKNQDRLLGVDDKWREVKPYIRPNSALKDLLKKPSITAGEFYFEEKPFESEIVDILIELVKCALPMRSDLVERLIRLKIRRDGK
jgi:hypothetical protein